MTEREVAQACYQPKDSRLRIHENKVGLIPHDRTVTMLRESPEDRYSICLALIVSCAVVCETR